MKWKLVGTQFVNSNEHLKAIKFFPVPVAFKPAPTEEYPNTIEVYYQGNILGYVDTETALMLKDRAKEGANGYLEVIAQLDKAWRRTEEIMWYGNGQVDLD